MNDHLDSDQLSPFELPAHEVERILRTTNDPRLRSYFGDETYHELRDLVQQSPRPLQRGGPLVVILPGILGSTIGIPGKHFNDTIWFDPISLVRGDATKLALTARQRCEALDMIPLLYVMLRLRLRLNGYRVRDYFYDWRRSLDELGQELADVLNEEATGEIYFVAHSMGGLVARAALAAGAENVQRLVMLGTPNRGSFAAVQVLRGINATVQLVAKLDLQHTAKELTSRVFNSFPSIYQLLPHPDVFNRIDLFNVDDWPSDGPKIRKTILETAESVREDLAAADDRFHLIAGCGRETVTDLSWDANGGFVYHTSTEGDETVPLAMASFPGLEHIHYIDETHTGLLRNRQVARAVLEIVESGHTQLLSSRPTVRRETVQRRFTEEQYVAADPFEGRRGHGLTNREQAQIVESALSTLPPSQPPVEATGSGSLSPPNSHAVGPCHPEYSPITGVVVGRRTQHRLNVELAFGNLFDVPARVYVMGVYQNVVPSGPATYVDSVTNGALSDFVSRQLIPGVMGQVFMMPTGCHPFRSDVLLFAGLGEFDRFQSSYESVLKLVSENVVRTLTDSGIDELATVMLGGGSGMDVPRLLDGMCAGFAAGLSGRQDGRRFRRVVLCETNADRYQAIRQYLYWMAASPAFEDVELTLDEVCYEPTAHETLRRNALLPTTDQQPVLLFTRMTKGSGDSPAVLRTTMLTSGGKATVVPSAMEIDEEELDELLDQLKPGNIENVNLRDFGTELAELLFTPEFLELLQRDEVLERHLVVINDLLATRIPWETVCLGHRFPGLGNGMSRRLEAQPDSIAKWVEERRVGATLDVLLIVDPTEDLPGAVREGNAIATALQSLPATELTDVRGSDATKDRILQLIRSGDFDVVHYAGHAFFDPEDRSQSGLILHDDTLHGSDLLALDRLPTLIFLNACEAARVRGSRTRQLSIRKRIEQTTGVAEAFLRAGVAQFIGTYWPVGDSAAECFAKKFYEDIIRTETMNTAVTNAREAVLSQLQSLDWADYIHFGDPRFCLKRPD